MFTNRSTKWLTNLQKAIILNHVVEQDSRSLDLVFHALADSTRRDILRRIAQHEYTVTQLAEPFDMSLAAVSKHIKVLERASLLRQTIDGRVRRCRLNPAPLRDAASVIAFLEKFWGDQFASLDEYLQQSGENEARKHRTTRGRNP